MTFHNMPHYKITSDKVMEDGSTQTYTIGHHEFYKNACDTAETLSTLIQDRPFRVYRWSVKDRQYVQESYYLNGK